MMMAMMGMKEIYVDDNDDDEAVHQMNHLQAPCIPSNFNTDSM